MKALFNSKNKMRVLVTLAATVLLTININSQNLVKNPGFEDTVACPTDHSMINKAKEWDNCGPGTSDFFFNCPGSGTVVGVPFNMCGYQNANGKGYGGVYCYNSQGSSYREYVVTKLKTPLVIGQRYYVRFKVNRADDTLKSTPSGIMNASTNKIGVRFRNLPCPIYAPPAPYYFSYPDNFAHVFANNVISDFVNWTVVQGSFVADSTYEYLAIGNFFDLSHTTAIFKPGWGSVSYYYIDDVCVSSNSTDCIITTGIHENKSSIVSISPNPALDKITVSLDGAILAVTIRNMQGQILAIIKEINTRNITLDISGIKAGLYFLTTDSNSGSITNIVIKN